jgi:fructan beta-fructosidase
VDENNTSGFGKNAMVAIFTSNVHKNNQGVMQHQSLAYSIDKGRTWKRYDKNPIININRKDFRDPKVFWYAPEQKWVMALVIPDLFKVQLYESKNLTEWKLASEFGDAGDTLRIWECPDLFELPVENENGKTKWILSLSGSHPSGPGFVGMQYFVGSFDGKKFVAEDTKPSYVNYGKDFYAGIVYNHLPQEQQRTIMIGWANNWTYANQIPAADWRGAMAIPRELSLTKTEMGYRLVQQPVRELTKIRGEEITSLNNLEKKFELEVEITRSGIAGVQIGSDTTNYVEIGYDFDDHEIFVDRRHAGEVTFHKDFDTVESAPYEVKDKIKLKIFLDSYILEVFTEDGKVSLTDLTFLKGNINITTFSDKGAVNVKAWKVMTN